VAGGRASAPLALGAARPAAALQRCGRDLLSLFERAARVPRARRGEAESSRAATCVAFEALRELFDGAADSRQAVGSASASFIVAQCHRIVAASGNAPPSVAELCSRLRTSRRTLQDSFRQVADTTPVHYLRSVRLNAVRRRLMSTRAADLGVAQAQPIAASAI
jgi:transcriptional regulator GlxA family with amidase domain